MARSRNRSPPPFARNASRAKKSSAGPGPTEPCGALRMPANRPLIQDQLAAAVAGAAGADATGCFFGFGGVDDVGPEGAAGADAGVAAGVAPGAGFATATLAPRGASFRGPCFGPPFKSRRASTKSFGSIHIGTGVFKFMNCATLRPNPTQLFQSACHCRVIGLQLLDIGGNPLEFGCIDHHAIAGGDVFFFKIAVASARFGWHRDKVPDRPSYKHCNFRSRCDRQPDADLRCRS